MALKSSNTTRRLSPKTENQEVNVTFPSRLLECGTMCLSSSECLLFGLRISFYPLLCNKLYSDSFIIPKITYCCYSSNFRNIFENWQKWAFPYYFVHMCWSNVSCTLKKTLMNNPPVGIRGESRYLRNGGLAAGFRCLIWNSSYLLIGLLVFTLTYTFQRLPAAQFLPD